MLLVPADPRFTLEPPLSDAMQAFAAKVGHPVSSLANGSVPTVVMLKRKPAGAWEGWTSGDGLTPHLRTRTRSHPARAIPGSVGNRGARARSAGRRATQRQAPVRRWPSCEESERGGAAGGDPDAPLAEAAKRAGIDNSRAVFVAASGAWDQDDAAWFKANPGRSHRVRPVFPGEEQAFARRAVALPPRHEARILVRQVKPGLCARIAASCVADCPFPDDEPVLHALFDVFSSDEQDLGRRADRFADLVTRYSAPPSQGTH